MAVYAYQQGEAQPLVMGLVVLFAMTVSCTVAGIAGAVIPLALKRARRRPGDRVEHLPHHRQRRRLDGRVPVAGDDAADVRPPYRAAAGGGDGAEDDRISGPAMGRALDPPRIAEAEVILAFLAPALFPVEEGSGTAEAYKPGFLEILPFAKSGRFTGMRAHLVKNSTAPRSSSWA